MRDDDEQNFRSLGMEPIIVEVKSAAEIEKGFANLLQLRAQALVVGGDPLFISNRDRIAVVRDGGRNDVKTITGDTRVAQHACSVIAERDDLIARARNGAVRDDTDERRSLLDRAPGESERILRARRTPTRRRPASRRCYSRPGRQNGNGHRWQPCRARH